MTKTFFIMFFLPMISFSNENHQNFTVTEKNLNKSLEEQILLSIEKSLIETQINELQIKIKVRKKLVLQRLKSLQSLKKYKWGEFFLNDDINLINRNIKILGNLSRNDYALFKEYNGSLRQLVISRQNLQETETLLKKNVAILEKQQHDFITMERLHIESLIKNKQDSLLLFKGKLTKPLDGQLLLGYGTLQDRDDQFYIISKGERYKTKLHSPVKSLGPGSVIFRDAISEWRETLIVQHADNYYSVYAGLKEATRSIGDRIEQGELLGVTSGDDFYFELRHFDNPINPKHWYRGQYEKK